MRVPEKGKPRALLLRRKAEAEQPVFYAETVAVGGEDAHALQIAQIRFRARRERIVAVAAHIADREREKFLRQLERVCGVVAEVEHGVRSLAADGNAHRLLLAVRVRENQQLHGFTLSRFCA